MQEVYLGCASREAKTGSSVLQANLTSILVSQACFHHSSHRTVRNRFQLRSSLLLFNNGLRRGTSCRVPLPAPGRLLVV